MSKIKWKEIRPGLWSRPVDEEIQKLMPVLKPRNKFLVWLERHLTKRALDADTWACKKCTRLSSNFRVNCFWCGHPRQ